MKQTGWMTFVTVLALALSLTRQQSVDQQARNFVNTLETRNRNLEAGSRAMNEDRTQDLDKIRKALAIGRVPTSLEAAK